MAQITLVVLAFSFVAVTGKTTMHLRPIGFDGKLVMGNRKVTNQAIIYLYLLTLKVFLMGYLDDSGLFHLFQLGNVAMTAKTVFVQSTMISMKFLGDNDAQVMMVQRFTYFWEGSIVWTVALVATDRLGVELALFPLSVNDRMAG